MTVVANCPFTTCMFIDPVGTCKAGRIELGNVDTAIYNDNGNEVEVDVEDVMICKTYKRRK